MKSYDWLVVTVDCVARKVINKHALHNATEAEAAENAEKSRIWFTNVTGHFCDTITKIREV